MSAFDATAPAQVRAEYTLTVDDLIDGGVAANRVARRPWYLRRPFGYVVGVVVGLAIVVSGGPPATGDRWLSAAVLAVVVVVALGVAYLVLRLLDPAKLTLRWTSRQLIRGNPQLAHPLRAAVGDDGIHVASATGDTTARWAQYPYHVETPRSFVLLASDRIGTTVFVLPKRVLEETDVAALRALLAAHTRPLG
ncbi:YcxB family protein [Micromonospora sp. SL4-19]|uniref:YcxB family protein n=1 Tax=Micromonospora sp. SL4-19 TaxID=3399129 RepID=UPI003A4DEF38